MTSIQEQVTNQLSELNITESIPNIKPPKFDDSIQINSDADDNETTKLKVCGRRQTNEIDTADTSTPDTNGIISCTSDENENSTFHDLGDREGVREGDDQSHLFVGDLAKTVVEEDITRLFSSHGEVKRVEIKRDRQTGNSLGYGFVYFSSSVEAENAKRTLDRTIVGGRPIRIGWAQVNTNLFIGGLDSTTTSEELRELFRPFGDIYDDDTCVKHSRYGFVKFKKRNDAEKARVEMDGKVWNNRKLRVGWGDNSMRSCVHIEFDPSLPAAASISPEHLRSFFSRFGQVQRVSLPRLPNTGGIPRGFAQVHFSDTAEGESSAARAVAAGARFNGVQLYLSVGKRNPMRRRMDSESLRSPPISPYYYQMPYPPSQMNNRGGIISSSSMTGFNRPPYNNRYMMQPEMYIYPQSQNQVTEESGDASPSTTNQEPPNNSSTHTDRSNNNYMTYMVPYPSYPPSPADIFPQYNYYIPPRQPLYYYYYPLMPNSSSIDTQSDSDLNVTDVTANNEEETNLNPEES